MLETLAIILLVLWALGMVSSYTMGGVIHILLVVALVVLACAVNVVWALMPAALQRRWRARIGLAQRQGYAQNKGTGGCGSCSGCASATYDDLGSHLNASFRSRTDISRLTYGDTAPSP